MNFLQIKLPSGATLTAYLHRESAEMPNALCKKRPAMIICPGGAYLGTSIREQDAPAASFLNMGLQVFVLEYSVGEKVKNKRGLEELARCVQMIRKNSEQWLVDPQKVLVLGFSAGGHLAASLGVHWNDPEIISRCEADCGEQLRPDGLVLAYPVITAGAYAHQLSIDTVSADTKEDMSYWSLETQVNEKTPPAFIWHTMEDALVPVENSFMFAGALHHAGVPCECHFFVHGKHGMSVCTEEVGSYSASVGAWVPLCKTWIEEQFGKLIGC